MVLALPVHAASPPSDDDVVQLSQLGGGTDFLNASSALRVQWLQRGGDYVDRDGVVNGPNHHLTVSVDGSIRDFVIDISSIPGDLVLRFGPGDAPSWDNVLIDGHPADAFWVDATANHALTGTTIRMPMFVHGGATLSMHLAALPGAKPVAFTIDPVAKPVVPELPMRGPSAPPDILDFELTDEASLRRLAPGQIAEPFAFDPQWLIEPNGLHSLRFSSADGPRLISWFLHFAPQESVYARYCLFIEDDVADGMTELGVKLPGLAGGEVSWRMEHGPVAPANRGLYAAVDYLYDAESGSGYGTSAAMGATFRAGQWYTVEQYVKLNSPGHPDGIGRVWINGNLTWESTHVRFRDTAATLINQIHVNVYHGGLGVPKAPIHYRIASIAVSHSYIGPPANLLTNGISQAIEYHHTAFDHYFVTASATEIAALDRGDFAGWQRTGLAISVYPSEAANTVPVCRFFSAAFAPMSSHFYSADAGECAALRENPSWQFEGDVFNMLTPDSVGDCPPSSAPVYRLYNDGHGGAPNHRYTNSLAVREQMLGQGWVSEGRGVSGVVMCAPE
ncbi:MAG: polysaccharide lyase [Betaproteobacteria bacterium]